MAFLVSCSNSNNLTNVVNNDSLQTKIVDSIVDSSTIKHKEIETLNFTDSNGLKQGKWIKKWRGKIVNVEHYKDNLLHGYIAYYLDGNDNLRWQLYKW